MSPETNKISPAEIQLIISGLLAIIQLITTFIDKADNLTNEEKQAYLNRIKLAQLSVPEWK